MKPLFLDIDTQNDFVLPAGALYAPGAEQVLPRVAALNRFAVEHGFTLISTTCSHAENDPEFHEWPPHCISGTIGQLKPAITLVGDRNLLFEKQTTDAFRSERFSPLLQDLDSSEYVVYGVVTEVCVRFAAEGLLQFGKPVTVITDAVKALDEAAADDFLNRFVSNGGCTRTSAELLARYQPKSS